jgi:hypothetical protein
MFWFVFYEIILISRPKSRVLQVNSSRLGLFYGLMTRVDTICYRLNILKKDVVLIFFELNYIFIYHPSCF